MTNLRLLEGAFPTYSHTHPPTYPAHAHHHHTRTAHLQVYTTSVDFTPSGQQYDYTCGLCGNFNGVAGDDTPGYMVTSYDPLWPCMKVPSIAVRPSTGANVAFNNIWSWVYNAANFPTGAYIPLPAVNCPYNFTRIERPIINTEDTEDITQALTDHAAEVAQQGGGFGFTFGNGGGNGTNVTAVTPYPLNLSLALCQQQMDNSLTVQRCAQM